MKKWMIVICIFLITIGLYRVKVDVNKSYDILESEIAYLSSLINSSTFNLDVLESCGVITDGIAFGSCIAIAPNLILTAGHCLGYHNSYIEIGGNKYDIIDSWTDSEYDIGFVRVKGSLPFVEFGSIPHLLDDVYIVGCPYYVSFFNTITKGIVSYVGRSIEIWRDLIQVDAEAAPGSSGSPLFDKSGKIVGICVASPNPGGGVTLCESVSHIKEALERYHAATPR